MTLDAIGSDALEIQLLPAERKLLSRYSLNLPVGDLCHAIG